MKKYFQLASLSFFLLFSACSTAFYDHYTFTETLEAKVKANSLIRQSVNAYGEHESQVTDYVDQINKMLLYEQSKSKNPITIKMWEYLNNDQNAMNQFLVLWKEKETLSPAFTNEFSTKINAIYDKMLDYETKKDQEAENALLNLINSTQN